ncbi:MAG TPA: AAA family ATPase [Blastocatellia bacterium]|nr:AAA family ATPase [Blastocatellia bacterium]
MQLSEGKFRVPGWVLSQGTLRPLALLALLRHPMPPPLIVIEEIENGLDPRVGHLPWPRPAVKVARTGWLTPSPGRSLKSTSGLGRMGGRPYSLTPQRPEGHLDLDSHGMVALAPAPRSLRAGLRQLDSEHTAA